jgi:hypothetical protein
VQAFRDYLKIAPFNANDALFVEYTEPQVTATTTLLASTPANQLPGLLPPQGMWRGATLQSNDIKGFEQDMDVKLQVYRTFKGCANKYAAALKDDEIDFVAQGGILMYSTQPDDWAAYASGSKDDMIQAYAAQVKSLAPAKVLVAAGYEPDGHCVESGNTKHIYGTMAEYQAMYTHYQQVFSDAGVDNAVWIMDYSALMSDPTMFAKLAVPLWPGDDKVDWLSWNFFQKSNTVTGPKAVADGGDCAGNMEEVYSQFSAAQTSTMFNVPWAMGAWGTMETGFGGGTIKTSGRILCLNGMASDFASGNYPNMKMAIYYNSLQDIIGTASATWAAPYTVSTDPDLVQAFSDYLKIAPFNANDALFVEYTGP